MPGDVRFRIDGKVYDTGSVDQISLKDILVFNREAPEALGIDWNDVQRISTEMAELAEDGESQAHPDAMVMFAVTVWAARRSAGENISIDEAIDVPVVKIEVLETPKAPKDHQPKSAKKPRKASGLAAVPAAAKAPSTTPATSSKQSATA